MKEKREDNRMQAIIGEQIVDVPPSPIPPLKDIPCWLVTTTLTGQLHSMKALSSTSISWQKQRSVHELHALGSHSRSFNPVPPSVQR